MVNKPTGVYVKSAIKISKNHLIEKNGAGMWRERVTRTVVYRT